MGNTYSMKTFLEWISESVDVAQSWMCPKGKFHSTQGNTHSAWAYGMGKSPEDLFRAGWMRLTYVGNTLYLNNDFFAPNMKQKKEVIEFVLENKPRFEKIVFDNGIGERELFSIKDKF